MSNKAAWIPKEKGQLEVSDAPMPKAGKDEVVIKNGAVAVNPVDCKALSNLGRPIAESSREDTRPWCVMHWPGLKLQQADQFRNLCTEVSEHPRY